MHLIMGIIEAEEKYLSFLLCFDQLSCTYAYLQFGKRGILVLQLLRSNCSTG
jgi:hypothetical protein